MPSQSPVPSIIKLARRKDGWSLSGPPEKAWTSFLSAWKPTSAFSLGAGLALDAMASWQPTSVLCSCYLPCHSTTPSQPLLL
jgi:hypothetical protein